MKRSCFQWHHLHIGDILADLVGLVRQLAKLDLLMLYLGSLRVFFLQFLHVPCNGAIIHLLC